MVLIGTVEVIKILSPQIIGDDHPTPSWSYVQAMFLSLPHSSGRFLEVASILLSGPLNWGQFCCLVHAVNARTARISANPDSFGVLFCFIETGFTKLGMEFYFLKS